MTGSLLIGELEQKLTIRFTNVNDFETFVNAIDDSGYDSDDVTFRGWFYKLNTPEFNKVNRSQYGRGTDYKQDIVEFIGNNCCTPASGNCFIKCNKYFTKKDYTQEFSTFIQTEQRRSNVMTSARIQPICRKYNIKIGCYDGFRVFPRNVVEKNIGLYVHDNHFCLIRKSQGVSFNKLIEDALEKNLKVVDSCISDKLVKSFIKFEYKHKTFQSQKNK